MVIQTEGSLTVALETDLGLACKLTANLQRLRKDQGFEVTDRIRVALSMGDGALAAAIGQYGDWIAAEILAEAFATTDGGEAVAELDIEGHALSVVTFEVV